MHAWRRKKAAARVVRRLRVILLIAALLWGMMLLDAQLRPVITTMAQYQCRVISLLAINEAVMEELTQRSDADDALVLVEKTPDGDVSSVEINSVEVNRLKTQLTDAVAQRLSNVQQQDVHIPLGTLLGWQLLAGRGPEIHLQILPTSYVESSIVDALETAGINQTQHRIFIKFSVEMTAILPGYSTSVTVENQVCVAQTLIVGKVPQYYSASA